MSPMRKVMSDHLASGFAPSSSGKVGHDQGFVVCGTPAPAGQFVPVTREVRAVVTGLPQFLPGTIVANPASQVPGTPGATATAHGIFYGQYPPPTGAYTLPETVPGTPLPAHNINRNILFIAFIFPLARGTSPTIREGSQSTGARPDGRARAPLQAVWIDDKNTAVDCPKKSYGPLEAIRLSVGPALEHAGKLRPGHLLGRVP